MGDPLLLIYHAPWAFVSRTQLILVELFACSLAFCINGFINGTGHTKLTLIANIVSTYAVRIPACILVGSVWKLGMYGIGFALPAATAVQVLIGLIFYLSGRWKRDLRPA